MDDFSTYLASTPPEDPMSAHHSQQQSMPPSSQSSMAPAGTRPRHTPTHQQQQQQQQQQSSGQQQVPSHNLTPAPSPRRWASILPRSRTRSHSSSPFLTGPTVAPGGGGDVIPGSASNFQQPDSYSSAWFASGTQNSHASAQHPLPQRLSRFLPYAMQSSQDDQYASSSDRPGLMQAPDMLRYPSQETLTVHSAGLWYELYVAFLFGSQPAAPAAAVDPAPAPMIGPLPTLSGTVMPGLYSTSGFDMLGVLARVASRPNPKIVLGPVDLTCSFTVVDVKRYDHPIVYSPTFHRLTGYEPSEIMGAIVGSCKRPGGGGSTRTYTDNAAVAHFKKSLAGDKECQASLINYRKNGAPFINLVSIIPINGIQMRFVDLVDQPHAILQTMRGSYIVNYSLQSNPQPALSPGRDKIGMLNPELRRIIANTMSTGGFSTSEEQERQDLICCCSKTRMTLSTSYLSKDLPLRVTEHIVPVMRELKESSTIVPSGTHGVSVQRRSTCCFVFDARRAATSGSKARTPPCRTWKRRKAIILSGRKKEVPRLQWSSIARAEVSEIRSSGSDVVDGLVLVASAGVHEIMGYTPDEFLGTNLIVDHILEEWKPSSCLTCLCYLPHASDSNCVRGSSKARCGSGRDDARDRSLRFDQQTRPEDLG
ncbi:White collar 1 protein [Ceratobasidium sp. AG-Ba]|nr:White collar 1 protein [Ceratobasidium sp. AG-Ba]